MADHVEMNYSAITDWMFVGTNVCCKTHFDATLLRQGVTADISLESERIDAPWGIKYFLWLPTIDHTSPTIQSLAMGVQMLRFCEENKIKVYIHCQNGHGRAPTLAAAYFVSQGQSAKNAVKMIQKARKEIHIEPVQLATLEQFSNLYRW